MIRRAAAMVFCGSASVAACWQDTGDAAEPRGLPTGDGRGTPDGIGPPSGSPTIPRIAPPFDVVKTSGAIAEWPRIIPGVATRTISSFDRAGGNDDGFGGTWSRLYEDPDTKESVIFD